MKILYVVAECFPFIKTGGLGDVAYSFPKALVNEGVDARIILPYFQPIDPKYVNKMQNVMMFSVKLGTQNHEIMIKLLEHDGMKYYFVENTKYYSEKKEQYYKLHTDAAKYLLFSKAVVQFIQLSGFIPDLLHLNDWHTGAIPLLLKLNPLPEFKKIKIVYTIHNLQYQGVFGKDHVLNLINLNGGKALVDKVVCCDIFSFMSCGIILSDIVTTVSPTYMREIQGYEFGMGLNLLLQQNSGKLHGILNGLDISIFNPEIDETLHQNYNETNWKEKKVLNKTFLQEKLCFDVDSKKFMIGIVSRIVDQKGFDILNASLNQLLSQLDIQLVVIGVGNKNYEQTLKHFANAFPKKLHFINQFSEEKSRWIYAGADALLVPSFFEPCGLTQMIALKYGTVPIVRQTGGLADTVINYEEPNGTGFLFQEYHPHALLKIVTQASEIYKQNPTLWEKLINNGLKTNFSWKTIAEKYLMLYKQLV